MIRALCTVAVIMFVLAGYVPHGDAQSPQVTSISPAALEETTRLKKQIEKLFSEGNFQDAIPLAEHILSLREKALGPMHPDVAESLNNLGELYRAQGAFSKVESLFVRALDIREKARSPVHLDVAESLNNLGEFYRAQGAFSKAEPLLARALDIREQALGPMHRDVAESLNDFAIFHQDQGAYAKAEPLFLRALGIFEKTLGPMHPDVATSLDNLGGLYLNLGAYEKAEPLFLRALNIREKALGPRHPDLATILNNLSMLYHAQRAYRKAEPLLVRALDILENALGPMHPNIALCLNNLATLYQNQGAYEKAEPLFVRALGIAQRALGPMHPNVAISLNNLALLYRVQEAYSKAEPLQVRALDILEKALGSMNPNMAGSLNNLAELYEAQGTHGKAQPLHVRALDIREKALGPMHPDVAESLNNLAMVYQAQRAYSKAEPLHVRALDIREKALGPMHPDVALSLNNLAALHRALGAYRKAEPLMSRAAEIREGQLRLELARLTEPRKRALIKLLQAETDSLVSLHADAVPSSGPALELALTTILRRKGRVLDSLIDHETTLRAHLTPPLREQLDQLTHARAALVAQLYPPSGPRNATARATITAARTRIDELESALSIASAEFRAQSEPVTVAKVQAALPQGAALVELVRYRRVDPRQAQPRQEERYVAYLLTSHDPPQAVALGEVAPIDTEVDAVLAAMSGKVSAQTAKAALQRLDALVFAPIRARLTGVSHVILAPDGKLNLVPFEALVDPQGHYELENYLVSYVATGRDLLRLAAPHKLRSSAVIVAGPDYGPLSSSKMPGTVSFAPLAGALGEATGLRRYFPTPPLTGERATKAALAALTGPAILHIATHGFYARAPDMKPALVPGAHSRGIFVSGDASSLRSPPRAEDPADGLDRAGLALTGANRSPAGIVTAREIAGFDWQGTQLVVLSACETGVGAVPSGDGVYGMRRALVLAGAASQVVSLWNVSDLSTRALMRDYYDELAHGTGRAEALRRAKLRMMRQPNQPRYAHPYYWAAFIPAGDWRSLDKNAFAPQKPRP